MVTRVNLRCAKVLLSSYSKCLAYLKEVDSKSGKCRIIFGVFYHGDTSRVMHFTTDYLSPKTSYRFMCSL